MSIRVTLAVLTISVGLLCGADADGQEKSQPWDQLSSVTRRASGRVTITKTVDGREYSTRVATLQRSGDLALWEVETKVGDGGRWVTCVGAKYDFELRRKQSEWVLTNYIDKSGDRHQGPTPIKRKLDAETGGLLTFALEVEGRPVADLIASKSVVVREKADTADERVIELKRAAGYERSIENFIPFETCLVTLDKAKCWTVKNYSCTSKYDNAVAEVASSTSGEVHLAGGTIPAVITVVSKQQRPDRSLVMNSRYDYDLTNAEVDPSAFRLTPFGLPEPVTASTDRSKPTFVWLIVAAVFFALVAVVIRQLSLRARTVVS